MSGRGSVRLAKGRRLGTTLAVVAVVALVASACGSPSAKTTTARPARPAPLTSPPTLLVPSEGRLSEPAAPAAPVPETTAVPLQQPVGIPTESYAEEPVVEFGMIEIPKIDLVHRLFQGVTLNNIDYGPSHWPGTAIPGQRGNTVFAGHRTTRSQPFRRLDELELGDSVIFRVNGVRSTYKVSQTLVVQPEDTWIADQTQEATGTLYACHPPGWADYRIVVKLALVSTAPEV